MKTYFKFHCVYCGQHLECEPRSSGRQIRCPACESRIVIPAEPEQPVKRNPLTKFTWDTVVQVPEVKDSKPHRE